MIKYFFLLIAGLFLFGCSKKEDPYAISEQPKESTTVMLHSGKGALLILFPQPTRGEEWFSLITLKGQHPTEALPRIPLANRTSTVVLNIEPGLYDIQASAWTRSLPPYAGGRLDSVMIQPGTVAVLHAAAVGTDPHPFENTPMKFSSRQTWTLTDMKEFIPFISAVSAASARG